MGAVEFSVPCDRVRGQGRPRTTRSGHVYETDADKAWKALIALRYREAGGDSFGAAPVAVRVDVLGRLPESAPKRVASAPNTVRPDVDNVAKAVMDALNGIAYDDDSQVVELTVRKWNRTRRCGEELRVRVWEA